MTKLVYLASPYTHRERVVCNDRVEAADYFAAKLMVKEMSAVFSPISHGHRVADHLPTQVLFSHAFWMNQCIPMLRRCDELVLLPLKGWRDSRGVKVELDFCRTADIPVRVIQSSDFGVETIPASELLANSWSLLCL